MPHKKYLERIKKEFPKHQWKRFKYLTHGWDHDVIILDDEWIFRFPKNKTFLKKFKDELKLMKYLNTRITLPIPDYVWIARDKSFAGYKMIKGKLFTRWTYQRRISRNNKIRIANQLAQFLNELHAIPVDQVRKFNVHNFDVKKDLEKMYKEIRKYFYKNLTKKEKEITDEYFKKCSLLDLGKVKKVFIHGDIHAVNMVVKNDYSRIAGIFDFSDRSIGDPAFDFAYLSSYGPQFMNNVYKKYKGPKDDEFLYRANLYAKWDAFGIMVESFKNEYVCTFEEGYKMFRRFFF